MDVTITMITNVVFVMLMEPLALVALWANYWRCLAPIMEIWEWTNPDLRIARNPSKVKPSDGFKHQSMDIQQSSLDGCLWFKVNRTLYPRIELMACDYMGVAATSVPSECAFSQAGTVVSKRRARLGDDAVQAICELQSFLKYSKR